MVSLHGTRCCGVFEIDRLSTETDPAKAFLHAMDQVLRYNIDFPFITFTGVVKFTRTPESYLHVGTARDDNYGETFAKWIEENKVGTIVRSEARRNWSENDIQIWIWQIDRPAAYALYAKLDAEERAHLYEV